MLALERWNRGAMGVVGRVAEQLGDPRDRLVGQGVLHGIGVTVHVVARQLEAAREVELPQPMVADQPPRQPLPGRGERGASGRRAHQIVLLDRARNAVDPATGLPIGSTADNLKASIAGETHEYTDMYPGMAKTARDEGFDEIADWFETLAKAERSHANRFQKALDNME